MSGPYISHVVVDERIRQEQLEQERRKKQRIEQLRLIQQGYGVCTEMKGLLAGYQGIVDDGESPVKKTALQTLRKMQDGLRDWETILKELRGDSSAALSAENDGVRKEIAQLKQIVEGKTALLQTLKEQLRNHHIKCLNEAFRKIEAETPTTYVSELERQERHQKAAEQKRALEFENFYQQIKNRMRELRQRADIANYVDDAFERIERKLDQIRSHDRDPAALHQLDVYDVQLLADRLRKYERDARALDEVLSRHLAVYDALCEETGMRPVDAFPFREESIREIDAACDELFKHREWILRRNQTLDRIHRYMKEKNLTYIGEKTEGARVVRRAYRLRDNIILHILYSSEGKMTIEIAMEDQVDRPPKKTESEQIVDAQLSSCQMLEEMFDRLNQAGLRYQRECAGKGGEQFAKSINTSNFVGGEAATAQNSRYERYRSQKKKYREMRV